MDGVLLERPVNAQPQEHRVSCGQQSEAQMPSSFTHETGCRLAKRRHWLERSEEVGAHQDTCQLSHGALFKVPRTPVRHSAPNQKSSDASPELEAVFKTPKGPLRRCTLLSPPPSQQQKEQPAAFPETPSPLSGHLALPSPLTVTNGVSQRVLPAVATRAEESEEDEEDAGECGICHDRDAESVIVYCDGCDLSVHPSCYGFPLSQEVPEGQWLCARCEQPGSASARCSLCPSSSGAMKRTSDWQWAHLSCSFFIPEVFFLGPNGNDYVHTLHVPRLRFRMLCHVCGLWHGACVLCTETGCDKWFHVTCGQGKGFAIEYRRNKHGRDIVLAFCKVHTAKWEKDKRDKKRFKISSKVSVKKQ